MDVNRALRTAAQTGRVTLGFKESLQAVKAGEAKLVVIASNATAEAADALAEAARAGGVPLYRFQGRNQELGPACGKPFAVAVMAVLEPGESDALQLARAPARA